MSNNLENENQLLRFAWEVSVKALGKFTRDIVLTEEDMAAMRLVNKTVFEAVMRSMIETNSPTINFDDFWKVAYPNG